VGTLADIHARASKAGLGLPALTIVGEVVRLRDQLRWFDTKPLFGKRVLVTRAVHQAGSLSSLLRDEAAQPVLAPTIRLAPPEDAGPLLDAVRHLDCYDWVLFTSGNAVDAFFRALRDVGLDPRALDRSKVCCIGTKTRATLDVYGIEADLVPDDARAEGVIAALRPFITPRTKVLLPRAKVAREVLPDSLRQAGAEVDVVTAYRTLPPTPAEADRIISLVDPAEIDAVLFTSSSTVRNLLDVLGHEGIQRLNALALFSIGPITTRTAEELGLVISASARDQTIESLVETVRAYYAGGHDGNA
jgi:uroporphyrinogen III methyltransferase/synthase